VHPYRDRRSIRPNKKAFSLAICSGENQNASTELKALGAPKNKGDSLWLRNFELLNSYPI
jgi:hypothetical protein